MVPPSKRRIFSFCGLRRPRCHPRGGAVALCIARLLSPIPPPSPTPPASPLPAASSSSLAPTAVGSSTAASTTIHIHALPLDVLVEIVAYAPFLARLHSISLCALSLPCASFRPITSIRARGISIRRSSSRRWHSSHLSPPCTSTRFVSLSPPTSLSALSIALREVDGSVLHTLSLPHKTLSEDLSQACNDWQRAVKTTCGISLLATCLHSLTCH